MTIQRSNAGQFKAVSTGFWRNKLLHLITSQKNSLNLLTFHISSTQNRHYIRKASVAQKWHHRHPQQATPCHPQRWQTTPCRCILATWTGYIRFNSFVSSSLVWFESPLIRVLFVSNPVQSGTCLIRLANHIVRIAALLSDENEGERRRDQGEVGEIWGVVSAGAGCADGHDCVRERHQVPADDEAVVRALVAE